MDVSDHRELGEAVNDAELERQGDVSIVRHLKCLSSKSDGLVAQGANRIRATVAADVVIAIRDADGVPKDEAGVVLVPIMLEPSATAFLQVYSLTLTLLHCSNSQLAVHSSEPRRTFAGRRPRGRPHAV